MIICNNNNFKTQLIKNNKILYQDLILQMENEVTNINNLNLKIDHNLIIKDH